MLIYQYTYFLQYSQAVVHMTFETCWFMIIYIVDFKINI